MLSIKIGALGTATLVRSALFEGGVRALTTFKNSYLVPL